MAGGDHRDIGAGPAGGRRLWRSLEELAETDAFRRRVEAEFPSLAPLLCTVNRREVLRVMGASLALAGLTGCGVPEQDKSVPYVEAPEFLVPGQPRAYASATLLNGYAMPVLVRTVDGRPIKVEGNPEHPASRRATSIFSQAAVLDLYDPDRSSATLYDGRIAAFDAFQLALSERARALSSRQGQGLAILSGAVTSPTTVRQMQALRQRLPELAWYVHEPLGGDRHYAATRLAFGAPYEVRYRLDRADVVLCLDADLLGPGPAQLVHAGQWAGRRRSEFAGGRLPDLHVLEPTPSLTGARASRRTPASSAEIINFALALAQSFGLGPASAPDLPLAQGAGLRQVADELKRAGPAGLVVAGSHLPPAVQALVLVLNDRLGSIGRTFEVTAPVEALADREGRTLVDLAVAIDAGAVDTLIILDANPVYSAPVDLGFGDRLQRVPLRVHLGAHVDETAALCHWHVPLAHPFETWSDARAVDGTAGVLQPLVRPLFGGRSVHELLATLAGEPHAAAYDLVRATWRDLLPGADFEAAWQQVLEAGFAPETAATPRSVPVQQVPPPAPPAPVGTSDQLEAVIRPDPCIWDGRFANNGWLQELPRPFTKLTWDNALLISPELAAARSLQNGDLVDVSDGTRRLRAPVWIQPGQAPRTVTLHLGYGRGDIGRVGGGIGYDAYRLRASAEPWTVSGLILQATDQKVELATTQAHHALAGHEDLVRSLTPAAVQAGEAVEAEAGPRPSLYPEWPDAGLAWGMAIDMDACIGCNACVVACTAENNVPVVGKDQVLIGREMHWLRIDLYHSGPPENPESHWQPVPCMHCERAPCELGCPVNATVHGPDGLNQMIYNRCVGTRTCASYCPYKVRRFNFLAYTDEEGDGRIPQRNPDVTVRARGVMEKCTYCVQRISAARIQAEEQGRDLRDGEVVTACQQACPTRAIIFGNLNDPQSEVAKAKAGPRNYTLLAELNTRPRTSYLAEVRPAPRPDEA